jgi:hypothetical protein
MSDYQLTHSVSDIDAALTRQINSVSDLSTAAGNTNFAKSSAVDNYINSQLPALQATIETKVAALNNAAMNNARGMNGEHSQLSPQNVPQPVTNENTTGVPLFVSYFLWAQGQINDFRMDISNDNFSSYLTVWRTQFDSAHSSYTRYHQVTAKAVVPPGYKWKISCDIGYVHNTNGTVYRNIFSRQFDQTPSAFGHNSIKLQ